jgi:hypothetical protein
MKNIVYVIVIFFWILSMISKSKRQKQQAAERERIKNLNKLMRERPEIEQKKAVRISDEVAGVFTKQESQQPATDYESAYESTNYAPEEKTAEPSSYTEEKTISQFRRNSGMKKTLGTESPEEKEAYDKDKVIIPRFSLSNAAIKQYVIAAEILGKPKALKR